MSEIALQAVGLVRRLEGEISHTLVNGIDLSVNKGEFVAITGPSGSGKSSLLYLLGLLDAPTDGEVIVWEGSSGHPLHSHRFPSKTLCTAFTPDGRSIGAGTGQARCYVLELPRHIR